MELLIHKGKFLSQPRKTPHYLNIEFIVFPFRLKSENFIVFRKWVVPEKIHTPPTDGILEILAGGGVEDSGNPGGRGG